MHGAGDAREHDRSDATGRGRRRRFTGWFWTILCATAVCRLAIAAYHGLENNRGDFYATLPGAYAESLNPTLWNSPDLQLADGYQRAEYLYGPTQYLTLFPLVFLDSYDSLATLLLFLYMPLIVLAAYMMWKSSRLVDPVPAYGYTAVFASTALFLPLLQAYGQREFEVVILFVMTCALYAVLTAREGLAGALVAYATWFKFFQLAFLLYFAIRLWKAAALGFVLMSAALLVVTEAALDLSKFRPVIDLAWFEARAAVVDDAFCEAWSQPGTRGHAVANTTRASIKWALCSFKDRWPWLPSAQGMHAAGVALVLAILALGFWRLRHGPVDVREERWRRSLEVGLLATAPSLLLHAHYYYLTFTIVPLNMLLIRYLCELEAGRRCKRLWAWGATYMLLSAFVIPPSVLSHVLGMDVWRVYMRNNMYFFGEMLLLLLVLWEYLKLPAPRDRSRSSG